MVSLYRDPDGEGILGPLTANNANTVVNITLNGPEEVEELKRRIAVMEKTMKTLKVHGNENIYCDSWGNVII